MLEMKFMESIYKKARVPSDLPWHSEEPSGLLVKAIKRRDKPGKALDLGCGAGIFSVYLAKQGYEVTALDIIPRALEMGEEEAKKENVKVNWVLADLLSWETIHRFDIVLDSGCLHNITSGILPKYKNQLLTWLAPGSDFILGHFGKRNFLDWRPVGPRRRTRNELARFLSPELTNIEYEQEIQTGIPIPIGPSVQLQDIWFKKK